MDQGERKNCWPIPTQTYTHVSQKTFNSGEEKFEFGRNVDTKMCFFFFCSFNNKMHVKTRYFIKTFI